MHTSIAKSKQPPVPKMSHFTLDMGPKYEPGEAIEQDIVLCVNERQCSMTSFAYAYFG